MHVCMHAVLQLCLWMFQKIPPAKNHVYCGHIIIFQLTSKAAVLSIDHIFPNHRCIHPDRGCPPGGDPFHQELFVLVDNLCHGPPKEDRVVLGLFQV